LDHHGIEGNQMKKIRNYLRIVNEFINTQSPFDFEIVGSVHYGDTCYPFISLHTHSKLAKYNVVISSGAHGEEAVGVRVMLRLLQEFNKDFLNYFNFLLLPIVNPWGYTFNRRKNGNQQYGNTGFNQNDDLLTPESKLIKEVVPPRVDLFLDVHCDVDKQGYYLYERKRPNKISIGERSLNALRQTRLPVLSADTVYKEKCVNGVIITPQRDNSQDDSMFQRGAIYSICIEIPGKIPEDQQIIGGLFLLNELLTAFKNSEGNHGKA
jgi:predicted deacylase